MKWFKHQTDASDDIKIKRLEDKFEIGYKTFFKIVEKVGKEGKNYELDIKKYPIEFLAKDFRVDGGMLEQCLTFMDELELIVYKWSKISIPNMKKYADEYTEKKEKKSGEYPDTITTKSDNRIDKIRIDKNRIDITDTFLKFYSSYPKKVNKKGTQRSWEKINPKEHPHIFSALKVYAASEQWQTQGGKFIPHPTTWLNQERWKDELPAPPPKKPFFQGMEMKQFDGKWKVKERGQWNEYGGKLSEIEWK